MRIVQRHRQAHGAHQGSARAPFHHPLQVPGGGRLSQCAARIAAAAGSGYFACQGDDPCTAHTAPPGAPTRGPWLTGPIFELDELAVRLAGGPP